MTASSFKVTGAKELQRALRGVENGTNDLKATHKAAADIVATAAKPKARRRTGAMAASVRATGQAKQGVVRAGTARLNYVPIQHFGHPARNISPNPFIYDAADARSSEVVKTYEDGVAKIIKKNGL